MMSQDKNGTRGMLFVGTPRSHGRLFALQEELREPKMFIGNPPISAIAIDPSGETVEDIRDRWLPKYRDIYHDEK